MNVFEIEEELTARLKKAHPWMHSNAYGSVTVLNKAEMYDPFNQIRAVGLRVVMGGHAIAGDTNSGFPEEPTADDLWPCLEKIYAGLCGRVNL